MTAAKSLRPWTGSGQRPPLADPYDDVPKDVAANIAYRKDVIRACASDPRAVQDIWNACSRSMLYYLNVFAMTYDPRTESKVLPFVSYDYQDSALAEIDASINSHDLAFKKSRDMGASWMLLYVFEWHWHFRDSESFLLVSRNEDYVDKPGNMKALFQRIDFMHRHMPPFMMPNYDRTKMRLTNLDNESCIDGESTTGDIARGDRRTAIGLDEFAAVETDDGYRALASTLSATNCRIFNSTPRGTGNAFYDIIHKGEIKTVTMHWTQHPEKSKGMYVAEDGKRRSPWYDAECRRAVHPIEIAAELDCDFLGSDYQYFEMEVIQRILREDVRDPYHVGELDYSMPDCFPTGFTEAGGGGLKLWINLTGNGRPHSDASFAVGIDISAGTGASNTVIVVGDRATGEKVAEWAGADARPERAAEIAVSICRWFNNAFMVPEVNGGPGMNFMARVWDLGYHEVFFREQEEAITKKRTMSPGWHSTRDTKAALYGEYRRALVDGLFINRSYDSMQECREIVWSKGGIVHVKSTNSVDPSGARENHGDRPTADALCWKGLRHVGKAQAPQEESLAKVGSMMHRRLQAQSRRRTGSRWQ